MDNYKKLLHIIQNQNKKKLYSSIFLLSSTSLILYMKRETIRSTLSDYTTKIASDTLKSKKLKKDLQLLINDPEVHKELENLIIKILSSENVKNKTSEIFTHATNETLNNEKFLHKFKNTVWSIIKPF